MPSKPATRPVQEQSIGGPLSREQKEFLLAGWGLGGEFPDEEAMRTAWQENRAELMAIWFQPQRDYTVDIIHWKNHGLGTRPWAFWQFEAPEPRRVIGGGPVTVKPDNSELWFGEPRYTHFDPSNPPLYESEAAYLNRLGLLTDAEKRKLTLRDFNSADAPIRYKPEIETR